MIVKTLSPLLEGPKFAVVYCGTHQYKVSPGDVIAVQRMRVDIGSRIAFMKVLMVGGQSFTAIGRPFLDRARVVADVEEQRRMRNVVSLFATPGRRQARWTDAHHPATILRIREVLYEPEVVGEIDKYSGTVLREFSPEAHTNPVYSSDDGYDIFRKRDTDAVESASAFIDLMDATGDSSA